MRLLVVLDDGESVNVDVAEDMSLGDLQALLEAETGLAVIDQTLLLNSRPLAGSGKTLKVIPTKGKEKGIKWQQHGLAQDDMLLLRSSRAPVASTSANSSQNTNNSLPDMASAETMRLQLLADRSLMDRIRQVMPELAQAAENNPNRFRELLPQIANLQNQAAQQKERNIAALNSDPFDAEAQRQIEEAIRQEQILENMEHAMEYSPESFGRVHMLYIQAEVNNFPIKAFVDSGAQATISELSLFQYAGQTENSSVSPEMAEKCGLMRLVDRRFAGIARGVGTAKIIGRVHSAQIRLGQDLYLACSFTVMEGKGVDLLFGLDMLKRHQAIIDLAQDALIIQGRKVPFLSEHEIPQQFETEVDENGNVIVPEESQPNSAAAIGAAAAANTEAKAPSHSSFQPFAGAGHTLGSPTPAQPQTSTHSAAAIDSLMALGVGREEAIQLLDAAGGNAEMAARHASTVFYPANFASLLFSR